MWHAAERMSAARAGARGQSSGRRLGRRTPGRPAGRPCTARQLAGAGAPGQQQWRTCVAAPAGQAGHHLGQQGAGQHAAPRAGAEAVGLLGKEQGSNKHGQAGEGSALSRHAERGARAPAARLAGWLAGRQAGLLRKETRQARQPTRTNQTTASAASSSAQNSASTCGSGAEAAARTSGPALRAWGASPAGPPRSVRHGWLAHAQSPAWLGGAPWRDTAPPSARTAAQPGAGGRPGSGRFGASRRRPPPMQPPTGPC